MGAPVYQRVLLKLSGQILGGEAGMGLDPEGIDLVARQVAEVVRAGAQVGVVLGGGNILRGKAGTGAKFERTRADRMGMLATLINSLALEDRLQDLGVPGKVLASVPMEPMVEPFRVDRARELLDSGVVVIFGGGTGHPYFSTDTAAALRALQIGAQVLLKGTRVDGVYDKDPERYPDAVRFDRLSVAEALARGLEVMDATALALCQENGMPIRVFDLLQPGTALRVVLGEAVGTSVEIQ